MSPKLRQALRKSEAQYRLLLENTKETIIIAQNCMHKYGKLKGEEIPLLSRVIAVVDAYDAMTTVRTYKVNMSKEEAVEELKRCAGNQFAPLIVSLFVANI